MQQYYTLEQAAQILRLSPDQLKEMARKKEVRAFQDRSGWRFRSQEIDEMARARGYGSDPELPLGEAAKAKGGGDSGGKDVFNFSLDVDESDEVPLGKAPAAGGSHKTGSSKLSPPKASSDSDVRLVLDGGDMDFSLEIEDSKAPASRGPASPPPKAPASPPPRTGSGKSRLGGPAKEDSGARILPLDQGSDSDVKITPSGSRKSELDLGGDPAKKPSDSDIRIEEITPGGRRDQNVTEEIDLDAEQAAQPKSGPRRRPAAPSALPTTSPFELSENDLDMDGPTIPPSPRPAPPPPADDTDSSSDFELKPLDESSSPIELGSDEEIGLGELTGGKGASGINLQDPADSGISLEQQGSDEMEFELSLDDAGHTPKPAPASDPGTDSSSDFELSIQEDDSSPAEGSSSEFELTLDPDAGLAVDEGSSDFELAAPGADSDSEFELTLDESGGLSLEEDAAASEEDAEVLETDFEVPALDEESGSEAVALDEADTDLESSEFDLSLDEESGSQVVPLEDEEEVDDAAATVQRPAAGVVEDEEGLEDLDADLDEEPVVEEDVEEEPEPVAVSTAPPPAEWGVLPALVLMPCTIILFVVGLMSFELLQGMWGYHKGTKVSNLIIHPIAKLVSGEDNLPDN